MTIGSARPVGLAGSDSPARAREASSPVVACTPRTYADGVSDERDPSDGSDRATADEGGTEGTRADPRAGSTADEGSSPDGPDGDADDGDDPARDLFDFADADAPDAGADSTGGTGAGDTDSRADADDEGIPDPDADLTAVAELDRDGRVELGVELLRNLELGETSLASVVDRLETVTTNPALTREILDTAERRGLIDRDGARIRTDTGGSFVRHERQVITRTGEYTCRRCGASVSTGYFLRLQAGELGPFGSSCVRKVTGRDAD